jgi:hypothetical protein
MSEMETPVPDEILKKELRSPGSDVRHGVNIIARPPMGLRNQIVALQNELKRVEPKQYFYPAADLHLTFIEICSGLDRAEATEIFDKVINHFPDVLNAIPPTILRAPRVQFDAHGGALVFDNIGALGQNRHEVAERLIAEGIDVAPRYNSGSAHITFMRYLAPVTTDLKQWATKQHVDGDWKLKEVQITSGANWYGMKSHIIEIGPFNI